MSKADSMSRPSARGRFSKGRSKTGGRTYGWDRGIALLAMVGDTFGFLIGGLLIGFGFFDPKLLKAHDHKLMGGVGVFLIVLAVTHLVVHAGLFASRRWAFVVAALLAGYGLSTAGAGPSGFMLLYTVLRLGKVFGPDLR